MITAKEARVKINTIITQKEQRERRKVERKIMKAIEHRRSKCSFFHLSDSTIEWLESNEYIVSWESLDDGYFKLWVVRW